MPAEGLEPPTNGLQNPSGTADSLTNQSLAALATPHSRLAMAQSWHTQPGRGANEARERAWPRCTR